MWAGRSTRFVQQFARLRPAGFRGLAIGTAAGLSGALVVGTLAPAVVLATGAQPLTFNFDTKALYKEKSTFELLFHSGILKLCGWGWVVNSSASIVDWVERHTWISPFVYWIVKKTFFKQFVAGEDKKESLLTLRRNRQLGMGTILNYSVEAVEAGDAGRDEVAEEVRSTFAFLKAEVAPGQRAYGVVKLSGMTDHALLEALSTALVQGRDETSLPAPLRHELGLLRARLARIAAEAEATKMSLLVDAEQTWFQPAIDFLNLELARTYNRAQPTVFVTVQMYLSAAPARLEQFIKAAEREGWYLGVKLVRGAYMISEQRRAQALNYPDPVQPSKAATDAAYDAAVKRMAGHRGRVLIGTHNEHSLASAAQSIQPTDKTVAFAQLFGMGDHLSLALVDGGYEVHKYVPYGPVPKVLPYLTRRIQENRALTSASASATERRLLWTEIKRRLNPFA